MPRLADTALSILDLAPIRDDGGPAQALQNALALARHAEALGFTRFWVAEHHNMDGIACSATAVLIGYLAAGTTRIRVGAGGIMLPNHAPLVVAEQFGTLATLYPGRIDLGLGRAPGTDPFTAHALRRDRLGSDDDFGRRGTAGSARPGAARPAGDRHARGRHRGADLAARLQPVQRPAGGAQGPALRLRRAFRATATCTRRSASIARTSGPRRRSTSPT